MKTPDKEMIFQLWDELADRPASQTEESLCFLLQQVCDLIDAQHAYWFCALKIENDKTSIKGRNSWCSASIHYLHEKPLNKKLYKEEPKSKAAGNMQEVILNQRNRNNIFGATVLKDIMPTVAYKTFITGQQYRGENVTDVLIFVAPVNKDVEAYICFDRFEPNMVFTKTELQTANDALRGLKWFHRQVMLAYGLVVAQKPLSPTERKILKFLLSGLSEKEIASELRQTTGTTHQYVMGLYRKFNVNGRAGLMALWLGN